MKYYLLAAAAATAALGASQAEAREPFIGQVEVFANNFCPRGFTAADGKTLQISAYTALYSLYGTTYGGDGRNTFNVPNLQGRQAVGYGSSPSGLGTFGLGQREGAANITLTPANLPSHNHAYRGSSDSPTATTLSGNTVANYGTFPAYAAPGQSLGAMSSGSIANQGGSQAMYIQGPYLAMTWCVALQGIFPSRN
jgi:microcystin-dependent protein